MFPETVLAYVLANLSKVKRRSGYNRGKDACCLSHGKEKEDLVSNRDSLLLWIQEGRWSVANTW